MSATKKKVHLVEFTSGGLRYRAEEENGKVKFTKDGSPAGTAKWENDEFVGSTAVLPDDVVFGLEKRLKKEIEDHYYD